MHTPTISAPAALLQSNSRAQPDTLEAASTALPITVMLMCYSTLTQCLQGSCPLLITMLVGMAIALVDWAGTTPKLPRQCSAVKR